MRVVAGVIWNTKDECLLAERPPGKHLAGLWEFPGGKIEKNESEQNALHRELKEELELEVEIGEKLGEFAFQYPNFEIVLVPYTAHALNSPTPTANVLNFRWVKLRQIDPQTLAPADIPILKILLEKYDV